MSVGTEAGVVVGSLRRTLTATHPRSILHGSTWLWVSSDRIREERSMHVKGKGHEKGEGHESEKGVMRMASQRRTWARR